MEDKVKITITTTVKAPVAQVWQYWTAPKHIMKWNNASDDWHTPHAENNLLVGGKFLYRMEARDGSIGFDFGGIYDEIKEQKLIVYTIDDERKVSVQFANNGDVTTITETFEAENQNPLEMQQSGWQAILDNFKKYTETH